jgi:diketogulonate reductase-like aldo/keto reductase
MAYSPLEQGRLVRKRALREVARRREATPEQVALAWAIRLSGVVAIPKSADVRHVREIAAAGELEFEPRDLAELDAAYPAPGRDAPLEML